MSALAVAVAHPASRVQTDAAAVVMLGTGLVGGALLRLLDETADRRRPLRLVGIANSRHSLFDLVHMEDELREIFGRDVDLVTRRAVERGTNAWRRQAILGSLAHVALAS